jgi:hypothetical protein
VIVPAALGATDAATASAIVPPLAGAIPAVIPPVRFDHLLRLSDDVGLFEHAEFTTARREHGYCVDDVARGLRVAVLQPAAGHEITGLAQRYQRFVLDAQSGDGRWHNRRHAGGTWADDATLEDCWGRALWGLGTAVAHAPELAADALAGFERSAGLRSPWPRAMAFAALGAAGVLDAHPDHNGARALLREAARLTPRLRPGQAWRWPESRLRYANAALPETLLAAGSLLGDAEALNDGLEMLRWLLTAETTGHRISVTPVAGWCAGEPRPGFDQQPIEVAALADACARAHDLTGDPVWRDAVLAAAAWFLGDNDAGTPLYDASSGGGRDGLERHGCNENQGAESTLAMMSTFQQAHRIQKGRQP